MTNADLPTAIFFSTNNSPTNWALDKATAYQAKKRRCSALCMVHVATIFSVPSSLKNVIALIVKTVIAIFAVTLFQIPAIKKRVWTPLQVRCLVSTNAGTTLLDLGKHIYKVVMFVTFSPLCCIVVGTFFPKACKTAHDFLRLTMKIKIENENNNPNPPENKEIQEPNPIHNTEPIHKPNNEPELVKEKLVKNDQPQNLDGLGNVLKPPQENNEEKIVKNPENEQPKEDEKPSPEIPQENSVSEPKSPRPDKKVLAPPPPPPVAPSVVSSIVQPKEAVAMDKLIKQFELKKVERENADKEIPLPKKLEQEAINKFLNVDLIQKVQQQDRRSKRMSAGDLAGWDEDSTSTTYEYEAPKKVENIVPQLEKKPTLKKTKKMDTLQRRVKEAEDAEVHAELHSSLNKKRAKFALDTFTQEQAKEVQAKLDKEVVNKRKSKRLQMQKLQERGVFDPPKQDEEIYEDERVEGNVQGIGIQDNSFAALDDVVYPDNNADDEELKIEDREIAEAEQPEEEPDDKGSVEKNEEKEEVQEDPQSPNTKPEQQSGRRRRRKKRK